MHEAHEVPMMVKLAPFVMMAVGFLVAFGFYILSPSTPKKLAERHNWLYKFLLNKWYFDELYNFLFIRGAKGLGSLLWKGGDEGVIDRFGPNGIAARVVALTSRINRPTNRICLSLCLCHDDWCGDPDYLFHAKRGSTPMSDWPLLSTVVFLPLVGAMMILLVKGDTAIARRNITNVALWTTVVTFLISLLILSQFDASNAGFQMQETADWLGGSIAYRMGVDGISILFVILTTALMPAAIYASRNSIQKRVKEYMIAFLVLETMMIGVFCALDLVLFYLFFEAGLIPMFLIIGIWGGQNRVYASFKFFLYTLAGSVLMLLAVMAMYWDAGTTDIVTLLAHPFSPQMQTWLWLAFFASFAVKMPMWPVHTWLPDAHVQAPTAGSVILAGVLLKMGGYGFLRFSLPMFPIASDMFAPLVYTLSVIAIIYTSLVALAQQDIKKLIAYSSVAHMGYVTMGVFSMTEQGVQGGIFQMISHGIVSGALFLCVGVVYDRMHTREISAYGGLVNRMPVFATLFMIFTMANVGLPGTSGFIGEFLTIIGVFQVNTWVALFAATGVILSASYALWLYRRIIFGKLEKESLKGILDMDIREKTILVPLAVLTILFGFYPAPIQNVTAVAVENLINNYQAALSAADKLALLAQ